MYKFRIIPILALSICLFFMACKKDKDDEVVTTGATTAPEILSIETTKSEIQFGGTDYATITAKASGGNLNYLWEVDLGDIIPQNDDGSIINFAGSACCIGKKEISLTVSNNMGEDKGTITINILAPK